MKLNARSVAGGTAEELNVAHGTRWPFGQGTSLSSQEVLSPSAALEMPLFYPRKERLGVCCYPFSYLCNLGDKGNMEWKAASW